MKRTVLASDGRPITVTDIPYGLDERQPLRYGVPMPVMDRDEARAGTTITAYGYALSYDSVRQWRLHKLNDCLRKLCLTSRIPV